MSVVSLQASIDQGYRRMLAASARGERAVADNFMAKRPSVAERLAAGKALRDKVPRASHATFKARADRPDPVAVLEKQNELRVQKLIPVRYARMLASPFAFFRGAAIAQGIAMRAKLGNASAPDAADRGRRAGISAQLGWEIAQKL